MAGCWSGRPVQVPGLDVPIIILECPDHGIPGKVWDGGLILSEYLSQHPEIVRGKRCLEVGAGTGVVGITVACLGCAHVELTDLPEHVPVLEANIQMNREAIDAARAGRLYTFF
jgi:methylase of polypeptide subunit release factors